MKILIAIYVDSTKSGTARATPAVPLPPALNYVAEDEKNYKALATYADFSTLKQTWL